MRCVSVHQNRRHLFGGNSKCPSSTFAGKLSAVERACCGPSGCKKNVPTSCNLYCAAALPAFVDSCASMLTAQVPGLSSGLQALASTCRTFPARPVIDAISAAVCPPTPSPTTYGTAHAGLRFDFSAPAFNGMKATNYSFQKAKLSSRTGSYSAGMVAACKKIGMKPVCDNPNYCRNDANALYIGQKNHIGYPPHRNIASYFPARQPRPPSSSFLVLARACLRSFGRSNMGVNTSHGR